MIESTVIKNFKRNQLKTISKQVAVVAETLYCLSYSYWINQSFCLRYLRSSTTTECNQIYCATCGAFNKFINCMKVKYFRTLCPVQNMTEAMTQASVVFGVVLMKTTCQSHKRQISFAPPIPCNKCLCVFTHLSWRCVVQVPEKRGTHRLQD